MAGKYLANSTNQVQTNPKYDLFTHVSSRAWHLAPSIIAFAVLIGSLARLCRLCRDWSANIYFANVAVFHDFLLKTAGRGRRTLLLFFFCKLSGNDVQHLPAILNHQHAG